MIKSFDWVSLEQKRKAYGDNFVTKSVDVDLSVEEGKNEIVAVVSTDSIDRSGEIVLPKGVDLSDFRKQPAVYFDHDTDSLPLGPCKWIKATDKGLIAKYQIVTEASELHKAIWELVKAGAYRSHSIGFLSMSPSAPTAQELRFHPEWKGAKAIHRKSSLLEFSLVGLPCNTDAVALAVSKGYGADTLRVIRGTGEGKEGTEDAASEKTNTGVQAYDANAERLAFYQTLIKRLKSA